jgi:ParB-like chromosome segregation protein Spo0J
MDIFDIPPHPAADAFPMMEEEELEELAQDIKVNGLQQPLVVEPINGEMVLIDGRNRREACRRAGVIPDYVLLDNPDPVAYILSANVHRRNLSKGQRAMAVARIYPEAKRGRGNKDEAIKDAETAHFRRRIQEARLVLRHAPDLADQVRDGSLSLDKAHEEAKIRKGQAETYESRFNALKGEAPDLAELVVEERMALEEAEAAGRERAERERRRKFLTAEALHDLARHAYLLNQTYRGETLRFVLSEAELYKRHNAGPVDEFIEALEIFEQYAGLLLKEIREAKHVKEG